MSSMKCTKKPNPALKHINKRQTKFKEDINDLKARSMRENLIFYGILESIHGINENYSELVKNLLETELKIDNAKSITFDRAHRLGPKSGGKVRPIVKFHDYNSREMVRLKSLQTDIKNIN
jgi:hypothetical protein